ncbi:hypothetical protein CXQ84_22110 [Burkholderia pseudomallei]|nr:hypothetical protein CXQ84_22110 [Burkholderia pseudomallei]
MTHARAGDSRGRRCNMAGGDIRRDGAPLRAPVPIMPDRCLTPLSLACGPWPRERLCEKVSAATDR